MSQGREGERLAKRIYSGGGKGRGEGVVGNKIYRKAVDIFRQMRL